MRRISIEIRSPNPKLFAVDRSRITTIVRVTRSLAVKHPAGGARGERVDSVIVNNRQGWIDRCQAHRSPWRHARWHLIRNESGEPVEIVGSWSDITVCKQAVEESHKL
jgi:hypothetical protein